MGAEDDYDRDSVHSAGGAPVAAYRPPGGAIISEQEALGGLGGAPVPHRGFPTQAEEIQEVSALAKDAAEILWEMNVMGEAGAEMHEIRGTAELLQAQLRGLINDYSEGDEKLYAAAFEAFEMVTRSLEDQKAPETPIEAPSETPAEPTAAPPVVLQPAAPAPVVAPPVAAAPAPVVGDLINFD